MNWAAVSVAAWPAGTLTRMVVLPVRIVDHPSGNPSVKPLNWTVFGNAVWAAGPEGCPASTSSNDTMPMPI